MPYIIRKVYKKDCYKVMNKETKKVHAKCTTKEKAQKQLRLLHAIDHNPNFIVRKTRKINLLSNK